MANDSKPVKGGAKESDIGKLHMTITKGLLAEMAPKKQITFDKEGTATEVMTRDKDWYKMGIAFLDKQKAVYVPIEEEAIDEMDLILASRDTTFKFNKGNVENLFPTEDEVMSSIK